MVFKLLAQNIVHHAINVFLFTKSDIKTTVIPVVCDLQFRLILLLTHLMYKTVFAVVAAPIASVDRLPHIVFWIWLHLLQFDISNQIVAPEEDKENKAYRPIASGRISLRDALIIRWVLVPICLGLSMLYSKQVLYASVAAAFLTVLYNELQFSARHWIIRNMVNAGGFMTFETAATLIAGTGRIMESYRS